MGKSNQLKSARNYQSTFIGSTPKHIKYWWLLESMEIPQFAHNWTSIILNWFNPISSDSSLLKDLNPSKSHLMLACKSFYSRWLKCWSPIFFNISIGFMSFMVLFSKKTRFHEKTMGKPMGKSAEDPSPPISGAPKHHRAPHLRLWVRRWGRPRSMGYSAPESGTSTVAFHGFSHGFSLKM